MSRLIERSCRTAAIVIWQIVGALLIGVATIFVMKNDPREHWAIPPNSRLVLVMDESGRGDEPDTSLLSYVVRDGLRWPRQLIA